MSSPAPLRDSRIDFWRGLCLVDMVLVHLVYQGLSLGQPLTAILGEYTRFAAGGFVFISGLSVGVVFLPRTGEPTQRRQTYRWMLQRVGFLLGVHWAAEFSYLLLYPLVTGMPVASYRAALGEILLFQRGGGLLPLYMVMIALSPLFLELVRRGRGGVLALASGGLFAWGQLGENAWGGPTIQNEFRWVLWQLLFVAGLLWGRVLPAWSGLPRGLKARLALLAVSGWALLWTSAYAKDLGLAAPLPLVFWKTPLSTGEALKYLAAVASLMLVSDLAWPRLRHSRLTAFVTRLGRHGLLMYVAHVWVALFLARWAARARLVGAINTLVALGGLGMLWALAGLFERESPPRPRTWTHRPSWRLTVVGSALVLLILVLDAARLLPVTPPATSAPLALESDEEPPTPLEEVLGEEQAMDEG
ncbi:OpgC domain-containing protein [Melittangium boletus]|uniref:OpgC domain-containing protein n=1 Tax=Melittangium boletus TaxID=83453 RepID=UPI003DA21E51